MLSNRTFKGLCLAGVLAFAAASCVKTTSRVRQGQLYAAGQPTYDTYFRAVHDAQVNAAAWPDEKQKSRKPLVTALHLTPDAPDVTIIQATHEQVEQASKEVGAVRLDINGQEAKMVAAGGASREVFRAIEETVRAELSRAKKLREQQPGYEQLERDGKQLETHAPQDFAKSVGKKVQELQMEFTASYDTLDDLGQRARGNAKEAEDFVSSLQRSVSSSPTSEPPSKKPAKGDKKPAVKPPPSTEPSPPKGELPVAARPLPRPPPAEAPPRVAEAKPEPKSDKPDKPEKQAKPDKDDKPEKPAEPGEVFNP